MTLKDVKSTVAWRSTWRLIFLISSGFIWSRMIRICMNLSLSGIARGRIRRTENAPQMISSIHKFTVLVFHDNVGHLPSYCGSTFPKFSKSGPLQAVFTDAPSDRAPQSLLAALVISGSAFKTCQVRCPQFKIMLRKWKGLRKRLSHEAHSLQFSSGVSELHSGSQVSLQSLRIEMDDKNHKYHKAAQHRCVPISSNIIQYPDLFSKC